MRPRLNCSTVCGIMVLRFRVLRCKNEITERLERIISLCQVVKETGRKMSTSYVTGVDESGGDDWKVKKEKLEERWAEKAKLRAVAKQAKAVKKEAERAPSQSIAAFHEKFKLGLSSVESELKSARDDASRGKLVRSAFAKELDLLRIKTKGLQRELADAALYLPSYDLQQASKQIEEMNNTIEAARTALAPRKKFAFGRKKLEKAKSSETKEKTVKAVPETIEPVMTPSNELLYEGRVSDTLVIRKIENDQDLRLSNLRDCSIWILNTVGALRCVGLERCQVYSGPVSGSCFIENANDTSFHIASRQVRIHDSERCCFLLNVCSRPIIENCTGLQFGQYKLKFPSLDELLERCGLLNNANLWDQVDDFKWLRKQHSPNWSILPSTENGEVVASAEILNLKHKP